MTPSFELQAQRILEQTRERYPWTAGMYATSTRGRTARLGGVEFLDPSGGRAGRTNPQNQVTRPGFQYNAQIRVPTQKPPLGGGVGAVGLAGLFDPSSAGFWRLVAVGLAFAYVVGFHVSLSGFRLGLGPGR
jgi:hypothetical protein